MRRILTAMGCLGAVTLGGLPDADARFFRSEQVPNGQKLDCGLCHTASNGAGARNAFGTQIELMGLSGVGGVETQAVVWSQIYDLDADEDGFSNGYELGDPDGTWMTADNDPPLNPSLPGDPESLPCGNNSIHPDEECDGDDFGDATCQMLGFTGGELACRADCTIDTSGCTGDAPDMGMGGGADVGPTPDAGGQPDSGTPGLSPDAGGTDSEMAMNPPDGGSTGPSGPGYGPYFDNPPPPPSNARGCAGELEVREGPGDGPDQGLLLLAMGLGLIARRSFKQRD